MLPLATVLFASCEMAPPYDSSAQWRSTENGVTVWSARGQIETRHHWDGPVDKENKAHGFGKFSRYNPDIAGDMIFGGGFYENTTTFEGRMVHGRLEGEVIRRDSFNGKVQRDQWANGEWLSGVVITPGRSPGSSGSGLSDGQLVGGIVGLGGIAGGDARVAGAGLTMLAGDESGGVAQLASMAAGGNGSTNPVSGAAMGSGSGTAGGNLPGNNLIDEWKLRGTVRSADDHMKYYIQSADQAFATYQKSGEQAYYSQHREYAELARSFHERTGTETQGYAR